jgi:hypothetical protein
MVFVRWRKTVVVRGASTAVQDTKSDHGYQEKEPTGISGSRAMKKVQSLPIKMAVERWLKLILAPRVGWIAIVKDEEPDTDKIYNSHV